MAYSATGLERETFVKVVIDWDLCQSHGVCTSEAPEIFSLDDDGQLQVLQEQPPESLRRKLEEAARYCPTQAISIREE